MRPRVALGESMENKKSSSIKSKKESYKGSTDMDCNKEGVLELLRGVGFNISRSRPDLYLKKYKRLGLYVCSTYKNGSNVQICIDAETLTIPEEPVLTENPTVQQKKLWDLHAAAVVENEDTLRQNMHSLYDVVLSLCDPIIKDKVFFIVIRLLGLPLHLPQFLPLTDM